jgi:LuxR family maltose regulon positive regulatory protein
MLPLLHTKTTIPPLSPRQIERPRLFKCMAEGTQRALTLIIAPAGFGKTTLAAAWAQSGQMTVSWLSLQATDCSREKFLAYLIQALKTISPDIGQTTLALLHGGSLDGALIALINDLAEVRSDFALILDDYHSVDSPDINSILEFLLENRPATFHLVIISRAEPSLYIARMRALDQVNEINFNDLRFTETEIRTFLETNLNLHLSFEDLIRLNQSTEGWAAGLQLAALALSHQPSNLQVFVDQEYIFDYLAKEVLRRESYEVQEFLKKSALFDRFCAPLCDTVFYSKQDDKKKSEHQGSHASDMLAYIEHANLFLVPLDASATWFRYHALFTDFLRAQLHPDQTRPLYNAASYWFEQNDLLDDAIQYAIQAADYERAANLIESHYRSMLQSGEHTALLDWISSLPPELLEKHPRLWLARGWANIVSLNSNRAEECASKAESLIPSDKAGDLLRSEAKALHILGNIFLGKDVSCNEILSAFTCLTDRDDFINSILYFNLGLHHVICGETAQAVDALNETIQLTQTLNNPLISIIAWAQLGEIRQIRGALGLAERTFQQAIQQTKKSLGEHTFLLGMPYISYADLLREQNRFDDAIYFATQGIAYCQIWQPAASMDGQIILARISAAQRDWNRAFKILDHALHIAEASDSELDDIVVIVHLARLTLLHGDLSKTNYYIKKFNLENVDHDRYYLWETVQLILIRVKIAELPGDSVSILMIEEVLSSLIDEAEQRERVTSVIEALILRAYIFYALTRYTEVIDNLSQALALGAQGGYCRIFVDEGDQLLQLLEQFRSQIRAPHSYLESILNLLRQECRRPVVHANKDKISVSGSADVTPLTRRELDILSLLAAGKTNQEIAAECVLTLNTVKKHVANILSKLGVANRTQAVVLARKMGWVE